MGPCSTILDLVGPNMTIQDQTVSCFPNSLFVCFFFSFFMNFQFIELLTQLKNHFVIPKHPFQRTQRMAGHSPWHNCHHQHQEHKTTHRDHTRTTPRWYHNHNHTTTTPQPHHNHTMTTPQSTKTKSRPHPDQFTTTPQPYQNHTTTKPQPHHNNTKTTPRPQHDHTITTS